MYNVYIILYNELKKKKKKNKKKKKIRIKILFYRNTDENVN